MLPGSARSAVCPPEGRLRLARRSVANTRPSERPGCRPCSRSEPFWEGLDGRAVQRAFDLLWGGLAIFLLSATGRMASLAFAPPHPRARCWLGVSPSSPASASGWLRSRPHRRHIPRGHNDSRGRLWARVPGRVAFLSAVAASDQRARLVATVYIVVYLAYSIPVVIAGSQQPGRACMTRASSTEQCWPRLWWPPVAASSFGGSDTGNASSDPARHRSPAGTVHGSALPCGLCLGREVAPRGPSTGQSSITARFTASEPLAGNLQRVLVDFIGLHLQGKQAHRNLVGHNFRDLHLKLDEIVDDARESATPSPNGCARSGL
jgi:hypothetical protein